MLTLSVFAIDKETAHREMAYLVKEGKYKILIDLYTNETDYDFDYDETMLVNLGFALLNTGEYEKAIGYFDRALKLDPTKLSPRFFTGQAWNKMGDNKKAIQFMEDAINEEWVIENEDDKDYYTHHAINLANIYWETGQKDKASRLLYKAKGIMDGQSKSFGSLLYNLSALELEQGNYPKAQALLEEILVWNNHDYRAIAKLVEVHHYYGDYATANELKKIVHSGHVLDELPKVMKDQFCIDRFEYNGKTIYVYERYQRGKSFNEYDRHRLYVYNKEGEMETTIKTVYSPTESEGAGIDGSLFMLSEWQADNTQHDLGIRLTEVYTYEELKDIVMGILGN